MAVSMEDLRNRLCQFVTERLVNQNISVEADTAFSDLGIDSHSLLEIILFLESEFNIIIPDKELTSANLYSVETLAACAERNQS